MLKRISKRQAVNIMLGLISLVALFHIFIIVNIIPFGIVWGGKLTSKYEMYAFETVSILMNFLLIVALLLKGNYLKYSISAKILNGILWAFVGVFALNTLGNLFAETIFEKVVFTPLTLISAILIWVILRKNNSGDKLTSE